MLARLAAPGLILALIAGFALWLARGGSESSAPAAAEAARSPARMAPGVASPEAGAALSRAPAMEPAPAAESAASSGAAEPAPAGGVQGLVLGADALPIARASVGLARSDGVAVVRVGTFSNGDGYFQLTDVPEGSWRVRLAMPASQRPGASLDCGTVQVQPGRIHWLDLRPPGTRCLSGRLLEASGENLIVQIELRDEQERIVAECEAVIDPELQREEEGRAAWPDHWQDEDPSALPLARRSGEFRIGHLAPGQYRLRFYYDVAREYWIERAADLRCGDADLGELVLDFDEFLRTRIERDPDLMRAIEEDLAQQRAAGVEPPRLDLGAIKRRLAEAAPAPPAGP